MIVTFLMPRWYTEACTLLDTLPILRATPSELLEATVSYVLLGQPLEAKVINYESGYGTDAYAEVYSHLNEYTLRVARVLEPWLYVHTDCIDVRVIHMRTILKFETRNEINKSHGSETARSGDTHTTGTRRHGRFSSDQWHY